MSTSDITFIGAGNMATSLIGGLVDADFDVSRITVSGPTQAKLEAISERFGVNTNTDNVLAAQNADVIVIAVKPKSIPQVMQELAVLINDKKPLIISVAAGVRIQKIEELLGAQLPIVRSMPNTPAILRTGATGLFANPAVSEGQKGLAESIMRSVGLTVWLDEEIQLDAVTALSGSGPAYFFLVIEAMQAAAEELGLPHDKAKLLTLQTALGASRMALESNEEASVLREQVTSPGGTTQAALSVFEDAKFKEVFYNALKAATNRATELSQ